MTVAWISLQCDGVSSHLIELVEHWMRKSTASTEHVTILNEGCFPQMRGAFPFDLLGDLPTLLTGHSPTLGTLERAGFPRPETVTH